MSVIPLYCHSTGISISLAEEECVNECQLNSRGEIDRNSIICRLSNQSAHWRTQFKLIVYSIICFLKCVINILCIEKGITQKLSRYLLGYVGNHSSG